MFTVRFPNGQAVQYNTANHLVHNNNYQNLYTKKDGRWIATVPYNCIVESTPPCSVYNPLNKTLDFDRRLLELTKEIKLLKRALANSKHISKRKK